MSQTLRRTDTSSRCVRQCQAVPFQQRYAAKRESRVDSAEYRSPCLMATSFVLHSRDSFLLCHLLKLDVRSVLCRLKSFMQSARKTARGQGYTRSLDTAESRSQPRTRRWLSPGSLMHWKLLGARNGGVAQRFRAGALSASREDFDARADQVVGVALVISNEGPTRFSPALRGLLSTPRNVQNR